MSNKHTDLRATHPDGQKLSLSQTTTDSPILPAANLQQLQQIDPSLVQWVVKQTETEADHRRKETSSINRYVFIERISGVVVGGLVAVAGLCVAAYVAIQGHDLVAGVIGGSTLVAIVAVIVTRRVAGDHNPPEPEKQGKPRK